MKAFKFIAAAAVFAATGSTFAQGMGPAAPAASVAAVAASSTAVAATTAASTGIAARNLNIPVLDKAQKADRDTVRAEARQFVKEYKTALQVQLDQYRN